jgi:hypothetical protein
MQYEDGELALAAKLSGASYHPLRSCAIRKGGVAACGWAKGETIRLQIDCLILVSRFEERHSCRHYLGRCGPTEMQDEHANSKGVRSIVLLIGR